MDIPNTEDVTKFVQVVKALTWAGLTVSEDGDRGTRFRPYRGADAPHSANSALQASDCPEDKTLVSGPSVQGVE